MDMRQRYLECENVFGAGESPALSAFLALYKRGGGKKVKVRGIDTEGQPVSHVYKVHERQLDGHVYGSSYKECEKLCTKFAQQCVNRLNFRLADLRRLAPTKLFSASKWPKPWQQRDRKTAGEKELLSWAPIMEAHHEEEGFYQGLCNFMNTAEATRLAELMAISLLDYGIDWSAALAKWREKPRRPAKSPLFASAERKRKGKAIDQENAHEKQVHGLDWEQSESDEDGEEEGDYDAADHPFLSDDEGDDTIEMAVLESGVLESGRR
ncbi:unnamed protein product [Closterium sp. Naga37s-1]|nr:unnamed protein product [Closterium sp. Naga37s-1]